MRRRIGVWACVSTLAFGAACDKTPTQSSPTAPIAPRPVAARSATAPAPGTCSTLSELRDLAVRVFGAGTPNVSSALGKLDNLQHQIDVQDYAAAKDQAFNINTFVFAKYHDPTHPLPGSPADLVSFINKVFCYAGLSISITDASSSWVVNPTDPQQTLTSPDGQSGTVIPPGTFSEPTVITVTQIPDTFSTPGAGPLHTKLDQYPGYYSFTHTSENNLPLNNPVVVAVCPSSTVPVSVRTRLRLGHDASAGFEITPPADASFLTCSTSTAQSAFRRLFKAVASLVSPKPVYAATMYFSGGVGGLASEFSPFAPVDGTVSFSGGVGGLASEFQRAPVGPRLPSAPSMNVRPGSRSSTNTISNTTTCSPLQAPVGSQIDPDCRPSVTVHTAMGTALIGVPVTWAITAGGGSVAAESAGACGTFGLSTSNATDANGIAKACWTMGMSLGTNTLSATPAVGGDVPAGTIITPATGSFSATAIRITPTATATGETTTYDGAAHAGSAACSNALVPSVSYSPGGATVPVNAGSYTLTVSCGDGGVMYNTATATATITIARAATSSSITCASPKTFTGAAITPCTASASGPGLSALPLAVSYSDNVNAGTASASAEFAANGNYLGSTAQTTFSIVPAATTTTVSCGAASFMYTGSAIAPCSASVTGPALSVPATVSYSDNVNAGVVTASASFAASGNYLASSGSATFTITPATTVSTISCPATTLFSGGTPSVCTGAVSGPGLSATLTPTYSSNVGLVTATVNYAGAANYQPSSASTTLRISYVQSGCFASPIQSSMPDTKSAQKKGSKLPVKCTLLASDGSAVIGARGDLLVQDMGTSGTATPLTVVSAPNVFVGSSGSYSYGLDTSPTGFVAGHFYFVTATWSDGSKTTGWFFIK